MENNMENLTGKPKPIIKREYGEKFSIGGSDNIEDQLRKRDFTAPLYAGQRPIEKPPTPNLLRGNDYEEAELKKVTKELGLPENSTWNHVINIDQKNADISKIKG